MVVIEELSLTWSAGSLDYYREMTRAALLLFEILLSNGQPPPGAYSRIRSLASISADTFLFSEPLFLVIGKSYSQED